MRTPLLLTCLLAICSANAQLINGSFESGLNAWSVPCDCAPAYPTPGGAPGGGGQCLGLDNVNFDCICMVVNATQQLTPWVTPGAWVLSGWIKSAVPGDIPGSFIRFSEGPAFSGPILSNLASSTGDWEFKADTFVVDNLIDTDSLRVSLVPDDGNEQPPSICYFDEISLSPLISTGVGILHYRAPAFRPNPASDKLWVELSEAPISIIAIDASGRTHALNDFTHRAHTFEVNVQALPAGITLLRITTNSGTQNLRFIKD